MEEIKIPKDLLDDFSQGNFSEPSENGSPGAAVRSLEKSLSWLIDVADNYAKERGLPGVGKMDTEDYAKLTTIVLERSFGSELLKHSPEFMWGVSTAGILASNMIAAKRQQDQDEEKEAVKRRRKKESESHETENE